MAKAFCTICNRVRKTGHKHKELTPRKQTADKKSHHCADQNHYYSTNSGTELAKHKRDYHKSHLKYRNGNFRKGLK